MKTLIVYDTQYSNTEVVARTIADALVGPVKLLRPSHVTAVDLAGLDLLVVGSPTHGGRPTPAITAFIDNLPDGALAHTSVTAFDTRFAKRDHGLALHLIMDAVGFAAPRIAASLTDKGAHLASPPQGFIVQGTKGPLAEGELERASAWARSFETLF